MAEHSQDPFADIGERLYGGMKPSPTPDFANARYPTMSPDPPPRPPTAAEQSEQDALRRMYPTMFEGETVASNGPDESTDTAADTGPEFGDPNPSWSPDLASLQVAEEDIDQESLGVLRDAPISDTLRAEVTAAWVSAHQAAQPHSIESGLQALREHFRTYAALRQAISDAQLALSRAPRRVRDALDQTQAGNDPRLIRAFAHAGRALRSRR